MAYYKEKRLLASQALRRLSKEEKLHLLKEVAARAQAPTQTQPAPQANIQPRPPSEVPLAPVNLLTWIVPEGWSSDAYHVLMHELLRHDPDSDAFTTYTQAIAGSPRVRASEAQFQVRLVGERRRGAEVSASTE